MEIPSLIFCRRQAGWHTELRRTRFKREFNKEFPYESELKQKLIRQQEINNELEIKDEGEELVVTEELPEPAMSR